VKLSILFLIFILVFVSQIFPSHRFITPYPMKIGERMSFKVRALGTYLGDQNVSIDKMMTFQGKQVVVGYAEIKSTSFVSRFYELNDRETTYFLPDSLNPVYNEKWIHEGNWKDHMVFTFSPQRTQFHNQQGGNKIRRIPFNGTNLKNYYTLVMTLRAIDYEYYISKNEYIRINYLLGEKPMNAVLIPKYVTVRHNRKDYRAISIEEMKGGLGFKATLLDDPHRTPFKMTIPSYNTDGWSIDFNAELSSFTPGTIPIKP